MECAYWTERIGIAPYLKKGTQVYAEGTPEIRSYTTKEGTSGSSLSLRISMVQLLGGRGDGPQNDAGGYSNQQQQPTYNQQSGYNQSQPEPQLTPQEMTAPMDDLPF